MKRFLSLALMLIVVFTFSASPVFADSGDEVAIPPTTRAADGFSEPTIEYERLEVFDDGELIILEKYILGSHVIGTMKNASGDILATVTATASEKACIISGGELQVISPEIQPRSGWSQELIHIYSLGQHVSVYLTGLSFATIAIVPLSFALAAVGACIGWLDEYISIYVKQGVSYKTDSQYEYVRRRATFYRSATCTTGYLGGPYEEIHRKALGSS